MDVSNPKFAAGLLVLVAGTLGGGSLLGYTIEPQELTELRLATALLEHKMSVLQVSHDSCIQRDVRPTTSSPPATALDPNRVYRDL